ncbi:hypothetical protein GCM10011579_095680 [Streptomyces albiflavescens]|uniref:UspA domain-containing protein n=1 Tax=Streptomyces albiflavescens TaxID=1623582 RepID=A0A918DAS5_9ACTN|nr:hypothetical protein GCM10011579_095680 [Streptomyces albiflavescens]
MAAAEGADLLILARDGDRTHLGPRSLGPASRFIVDHAPCPVLLVWPEAAPGTDTIPRPPPHPPHHRLALHRAQLSPARARARRRAPLSPRDRRRMWA